MSQPVDWDRFKVAPPGKVGPLGDPTRWGSQALTPLDPAGNNIFTEQIVFAQCRDGYSRSWSLIGQLTLPQATWNAPGVFPAGPFPLIVSLVITMGVGQAAIQHQIILSCGNNAAVGLCNTQNAINGGPYLSTFPDSILESRPFAAIGALIGNAINVRARYLIGAPATGLPTTANLSVALTAYQPGQGL
jgi:hypothetical protein